MTITNIILTVCPVLLIISVVMSVKSIYKEGGMLDIQNNKLLDWEPFDFLEEHFNIQRMQKVTLIKIFQKGIREDYFYLNVAKKMSLDEEKEYIFVRKKISVFEKKWNYVLWLSPLLMPIVTIIPIKTRLKEFIEFIPFIVIFFFIYKLRSKPYKDKLLLIQKKILQKMCAFLYDNSFFDKIELDIKLTKINRVRVPSNYYDLSKIISQIENRNNKT